MRVLVVEDDELLGEGVRIGLTQYGYVVDWVKDGYLALQAILSENFDSIVLDLGLPRRSGLEILKTMRAKNINTPVLILTAREGIDERVQGLDAGGDDYLVKPFDLLELCARIRALQRRSAARSDPNIIHGALRMDLASYTAYYEDKLLPLSRREYMLLQKLLENVGRVLSREQLNQTLYSWEDEIDSNALEVHIHNLRKKLGFPLLRTIRGVGYMIEKIE